MKEVLVRKEGEGLLTREEWSGHAVPDWTFEHDGRLYYCGIDYAEERGKCFLRTIGKSPLRLELLLKLVYQGQRDLGILSQAMQRSVEEIETSLATLERLGKVRVAEDGVHPVWEDAG